MSTPSSLQMTWMMRHTRLSSPSASWECLNCNHTLHGAQLLLALSSTYAYSEEHLDSDCSQLTQVNLCPNIHALSRSLSHPATYFFNKIIGAHRANSSMVLIVLYLDVTHGDGRHTSVLAQHIQISIAAKVKPTKPLAEVDYFICCCCHGQSTHAG